MLEISPKKCTHIRCLVMALTVPPRFFQAMCTLYVSFVAALVYFASRNHAIAVFQTQGQKAEKFASPKSTCRSTCVFRRANSTGTCCLRDDNRDLYTCLLTAPPPPPHTHTHTHSHTHTCTHAERTDRGSLRDRNKAGVGFHVAGAGLSEERRVEF